MITCNIQKCIISRTVEKRRHFNYLMHLLVSQFAHANYISINNFNIQIRSRTERLSKQNE